MPRSEVEALLGPPGYSPVDGQYYYSSDREVSVGDDLPLARYGLVVDYRDYHSGYELTNRLQIFTLGPIGE